MTNCRFLSNLSQTSNTFFPERSIQCPALKTTPAPFLVFFPGSYLISLLLNFTHTTSRWPWTEKDPESQEAPSAYFPSAELRLVVYYKPKETQKWKQQL